MKIKFMNSFRIISCLMIMSILCSCINTNEVTIIQNDNSQNDIEIIDEEKADIVEQDTTQNEAKDENQVIEDDNKELETSDIPSLKDFIGDYRGVNPFFVTNWETYEMSEDIDHCSLSFVEAGDGFQLTNIIINSDKPRRNFTMEPIFLKDEDMTYYVDTDNTEEELWDCFKVSLESEEIIFSKWRKNGQLMITIDFGDGSPQMFVTK